MALIKINSKGKLWAVVEAVVVRILIKQTSRIRTRKKSRSLIRHLIRNRNRKKNSYTNKVHKLKKSVTGDSFYYLLLSPGTLMPFFNAFQKQGQIPVFSNIRKN